MINLHAEKMCTVSLSFHSIQNMVCSVSCDSKKKKKKRKEEKKNISL